MIVIPDVTVKFPPLPLDPSGFVTVTAPEPVVEAVGVTETLIVNSLGPSYTVLPGTTVTPLFKKDAKAPLMNPEPSMVTV